MEIIKRVVGKAQEPPSKMMYENYMKQYVPTWKEKLHYILFPIKPVIYNPPEKEVWKDCINCSIQMHISFVDRIKLLITGRANVGLKIACENEVGKTFPMSEINIVWK